MKQKKILIIDDNPLVLSALVNFLQEHYVVVSANSGLEGLHLFNSNDVSLILLDICMKGMDGIEVLRQIRDRSSDVPVLMITGSSTHEAAMKCADLNVQGYILKPPKLEELRHRIDRCLGVEKREVFKDVEYLKLTEGIKSTDHIAKGALKVIHARYKDPSLSRSFIAEALGISEEYLSKQFHKECGVSLPEYITNLRLIDAARLLRDTAHKISQVSIYVGFSNMSYFSALFKKKYGMTPGEYRTQKKALNYV